MLRVLSICAVALLCGCTAIPINIPKDPDLPATGMDGGPYNRADGALPDVSISLPDSGPPSGGKDGAMPDGFTDAVTDGLADGLPDARFDGLFDGLVGDSQPTDGQTIFDGTSDGGAVNDGMVME